MPRMTGLGAMMVKRPEQHRWSSYDRNALGRPNALVSRDSVYQRLGDSDAERQAVYRALFEIQGDTHEETAEIRHATAQGVVLGNDRFRSEIEATLGRRVNKYEHGGDRKSRAFREKHQDNTSSGTLSAWTP